ncbi:MAG: zf-TFIIB domain-containing protein [Candidatus Uhrbacteria bacterium]|nr:zf-TFIIB domain-containing protein [Candidatus Uhrbacteria bacterium]
MQCPIDNISLVSTERGGIEIDYCPQCRGVWLDRGELDKLIVQDASSEVLHRESDFEATTTPHGGLGHEHKGFLRQLFDF